MPHADLGERLPSRTQEWASAECAAALAEWVAGEVGDLAVLEQVKLRVWASVWAVETADRRFYLKQNCELQSFEAALVQALGEVAPDRVVPVAGADPDRGLLLTPDQGQVMAATVADDDVDAWCRVAAAAAELQRAVAPHRDRLESLGLTTLPPADAPAYVERRLEELVALPADDPRRMPRELHDAVCGRLLAVRDWAEQVASLGLPVTLNHNDLHENNVFHVADELRFFDFADSLLTEPLGVLLIPLNVLAGRLGAGPDDPRLWRVADAALEVWSDLAPMPALRAALPAALRLARLGRVECWARCCASMDDAELDEWGGAIPRWLAELVADSPVG
ncbi:hypothetical protein ACFP3Q_11160 [Nocardioides sp. GCM10027113]|uniref:hypothetical protein n=1 Tax=unclassified Nocardioides TaxID=2615069 RepID=UPI003616695F